MKVLYDKNIILNVKSVSEKILKFKVLVSDTFKVFYAIFSISMFSYVVVFSKLPPNKIETKED